jgi:hypothetical protein
MSWTQRLERLVKALQTDAGANFVCAAIVVFAGVFLMYSGRHLSIFYLDEWDIVLARQGSSLSAYLRPHGGHFIFDVVVVYKLIFALFGLRHYVLFRLAGTLAQLCCATFLYLLLRRRIGAWHALLPTTMLLFMGSAAQDLLWPFQIGFFLSLAGFLAALWLLEHRTRRGNIGACIAMTVAIAGSGVGVASLCGGFVYLLVRRDLRRLWVFLVPLALFLLWYVTWGLTQPETITSQLVLNSPDYMASAGGAALAALAGVDTVAWAPAMLIAGAVLVVVTVQRAPGPPSAIMFAAIAGAAAFWFLTAIVRGNLGLPNSGRYLYVGAVFVWVVFGELFRAWGARARPAAILLVLGLALAAIVSNLGTLRTNVADFVQTDDVLSVALATTEVAGPAANPYATPALAQAPNVQVGPYLKVVKSLGSPAISETQLANSPPATRVASDLLLEQLEQLGLTPYSGAMTGSSPPDITSLVAEKRVSAPPGCAEFVPDGPSAAVLLALDPGHQLLVVGSKTGGVIVAAWRFAGTFANAPIGGLLYAQQGQITFPRDAQPTLPWHLKLTAGGSIEACTR